ncbi:MAG: hypothetical protein HC933_07260 [Pleurocapsa sp. SU_196_0]|nr:hypothetical protein [Pleurocapsa sp. SU_196_0]
MQQVPFAGRLEAIQRKVRSMVSFDPAGRGVVYQIGAVGELLLTQE